jgi:hypothetical protein
MRTALHLLVACAAILAAAPAPAELYKWVDERGVTNYSNEPPAAAAIARKLARVESTISVYTPDESFMQAVKALREHAIKAMSEPEPQSPAVARISTPPTPYERCLLAGRVGCDDLYRGYAPAYVPAAAVFPLHGVQSAFFPAPRTPARPAGGSRVSRGPMVRP